MENYNNYLNSDWWINKRKNSKESKTVKRGCLVCGCQKVNLHHLTYGVLGKEKINKHIIALCRQHHEEFHIWQKSNNKLVGDVMEWIKLYYPEKFSKIDKHQKGKMKKYTSRALENKKLYPVRCAKKLLNIINNKYKDQDTIILTIGERRLLFQSKYLLELLEIEGYNFQDKLRYIKEYGVNKKNLIYLLSNIKYFSEENDRIKQKK